MADEVSTQQHLRKHDGEIAELRKDVNGLLSHREDQSRVLKQLLEKASDIETHLKGQDEKLETLDALAVAINGGQGDKNDTGIKGDVKDLKYAGELQREREKRAAKWFWPIYGATCLLVVTGLFAGAIWIIRSMH